jgi:hypothetical protein
VPPWRNSPLRTIPFIDFDLLLAGVLLHDIGKIRELSYARAFGYSTEGQLLGHIHIGVGIVQEKLRLLPDFPPKLRDLLLHLILSHHGELEFGSPKVPLFAEALLLHHLDNLDSKMECVRGGIEKDRQVEGEWTGYISALDRTILKKEKYLAPEAPKASSAPHIEAAPAEVKVPAAQAPRALVVALRLQAQGRAHSKFLMRRPAPPREIPPPLELDCLRALWGLGEGSVRDVRKVMVKRELAYTTVMTVLDRLEKRGGVTRKKRGAGRSSTRPSLAARRCAGMQ